MVDYQLNCYKHPWILKEVRKASGLAASSLTNTDRLESEILKYVGKYLHQNELNVNHKNYITKMIYRQLSASLKRNKKEHTVFLADMSQDDDEGHGTEYEPVDVLANVESALEIKETITLLAKDDRRRELILNEWANGCTNDTELSDTLAGVLGGQSRSHCKFIQRFRIECRSVLTAAI